MKALDETRARPGLMWRCAQAPVTWAAALALLSGCAGYHTHQEGLRLVAAGQTEEGLAMLRQAHLADTSNPRFEVDWLKQQTAFARELVQQGDRARAADQFNEAAGFYQRALQIEPSNPRAAQGLALAQDQATLAKALVEGERLLADGQAEAARTVVQRALTRYPQSPQAKALQARIVAAQEASEAAKARQVATQSLMQKPVTL
jgi:general secretion pathway protein D